MGEKKNYPRSQRERSVQASAIMMARIVDEMLIEEMWRTRWKFIRLLSGIAEKEDTLGFASAHDAP
jgi:hypothetical protein